MPTAAPDILVVEESPSVLGAVKRILGEEYHIRAARDLGAAVDIVQRDPLSSILFDLALDTRDDIPAFRSLHRAAGPVPVVLLAGGRDREAAVRALDGGAHAWVMKPPNADELRAVVRESVKFHQLAGQAAVARVAMRAEEVRFGDFIARSRAMQEVIHAAREAGHRAEPVLILGEPGTGKSMLARAIHGEGVRRRQPFLTADCTHMDDRQLDSALFGEETHGIIAQTGSKGALLDVAREGTLLLDNLRLDSSWAQKRVTEVFGTRRAFRMGGSTPRPITARLIVTVPWEGGLAGIGLGKQWEQYIRSLKGCLRLVLPPLRRRREDIPALLEHLLASAGRRLNKKLLGFAPECSRVLQAYEWPGNVYELRHIVERMALLEQGPYLTSTSLPIDIVLAGSGTRKPAVVMPIREVRARFERQYIMDTLMKTGWNQTRAAELLGLSRSHLAVKIAEYDIKPPPR